MSDVERDEKLGGQLAAGLFLLGAPAALVLGALADQCSRKRLLALILAIGGGASFGTATSTGFKQLFWWRALTGVSLGAALPVTFSLLADLYPASRRTSISGRVGVAMSAGVGFGQAISGFIGGPWGWRVPFLIVGGGFLLLAALVAAIFKEPPRGACDGRSSGDDDAAAPGKAARRDLVEVFRTPTALLVFVQGIPGCIPWGVIIVFLTDYLVSDLGLSVQKATMVLTCFTVGGFAGMVLRRASVFPRAFTHVPLRSSAAS